MTKRELLSLCSFYKGGSKCHYETEEFCQLWQAEMMVCSELNDSVSSTNDFYDLVCAYVSKWNPYEYGKVLNLYFDLAPVPAEIKKVYS